MNAPSRVPRTLHVVQSWAGGGTEKYVGDLAAFLAADGRFVSDLALLGPHPPPLPDDVAFASVHPVRTARGLFGLLRTGRFAATHLHLYTRLLPATVAVRAAGVPCVTHLHQPLTAWNARHRLAWRAAVRLAGHVTAGSTDTQRSAGFSPADPRATLVPAPAPVPEPAPSRPDPADRSRSFTIAGVGRLSKEKDWPTLLRALPAVIAAADRPVRFVHLGDGPAAGGFNTLVSDLGLSEAVDARGAVPHGEVAAVLDAADLFVLPSRFEGLGIAPLEAMARGVPTVTADYPASADYLLGPPGGETGHTFPVGDSAACAGRILWHLRHPVESAAVGLRGRALVAERFTPAATFGKLPPIYAALAKGR